MLKDISSSSSEDEVADAPTETLTEKPTTPGKFQILAYGSRSVFFVFCFGVDVVKVSQMRPTAIITFSSNGLKYNRFLKIENGKIIVFPASLS